MKTLLLTALALALIAAPSHCQEVAYTEAGFAACADLDDWAVQQDQRGGQDWYRVMRKAVAQGRCWVTRDSTAVRVYQSRHPEAIQVRPLKVKTDTLWWVAREALK